MMIHSFKILSSTFLSLSSPYILPVVSEGPPGWPGIDGGLDCTLCQGVSL